MNSQKLRIIIIAALLTILPGAVPCWSQKSADSSSRKVLIKTQAVYPTLAQSMNLHGVVKLVAHVEPNGNVKSVEVKGGHPILTQSAVTAVGHWKFEPASRETTEVVEIKFEDQ